VLKGADKPDEVKTLKEIIESRLPRMELVDVFLDLDHRTDFLPYFLHYSASESRNRYLGVINADKSDFASGIRRVSGKSRLKAIDR
jgi:hypothetical protein